MENDWSEDIETVLGNMRENCVMLAKEHKKQYFALKNILSLFRLPVIIISGINSIVSVGLQPYMEQGTISMTTCLLALVCSIIGSIELYLSIQKQMENELESQQQYYLLGVDIFKNLSLDRVRRPVPAKDYLNQCHNKYEKLVENSNTLSRRIEDKLSSLPNTLLPTPIEKNVNKHAENNMDMFITGINPQYAV